jgi:ribonuclease Z
MTIKFTCVGCAAGMPHPRLAHSSYLVEADKQRMLLDIGEGASSALRRLDIDPQTIGTLFISHMHSDHSMGLPLFLQMNHLLKRQERLDIFLPAEAVSTVKRVINLTYLFPDKLTFDLELHKISASLVVEMKGMHLRPQPNRHLSGQVRHLKKKRLPNRMECYSFIVQSKTSKIVYSSDIWELKDLDPVADAADLLVVDGMHVDLAGLPDLTTRHSVKKVLLTHLPEDFDFTEWRQRFASAGLRQVQRAKEGLTLHV